MADEAINTVSPYAQNALYFKALSDPTRLEIIDMLSCGKLCACKILQNFRITQPTLSYHMRILTECGLVRGRREGAWMHYSLDAETFAALTRFIGCVSSWKEGCICSRK